RPIPDTSRHAARSLSSALGLTFASFTPAPLSVDPSGRTPAADGAPPVPVSTSAEYGAFMSWLHEALFPSAAPCPDPVAGQADPAPARVRGGARPDRSAGRPVGAVELV